MSYLVCKLFFLLIQTIVFIIRWIRVNISCNNFHIFRFKFCVNPLFSIAVWGSATSVHLLHPHEAELGCEDVGPGDQGSHADDLLLVEDRVVRRHHPHGVLLVNGNHPFVVVPTFTTKAIIFPLSWKLKINIGWMKKINM